MKPSKTDYLGSEALTLTTPHLELVVTTGVGPRVVSLKSKQGEAGNLFIEIPVDAKKPEAFHIRGGHRLWHAPEHLERTYQPDNDVLETKWLPKGVALLQPAEKKTGIQKGMKIELSGARTVRVTHTLSNRGFWAVETAPWALTMFNPGGYGVVPLPPKGSHAGGDLLPSYSLVPWSYTDLSLPVWDLHRDFIGINVSKARSAQKLGITYYPGWSAYWLKGTTFVKYAAPQRGAVYPDFGCCFETFTNGSMIELETLGALISLAPGKTATHVEHWAIFDGLAKPDTDASFVKLAATVKAWLARL